MKCEICGDEEASKAPEIDTITGVEWYMCEGCKRFFAQVEREMMSIEGGFEFSTEDEDDDNGQSEYLRK
jgi:hypothetical protein